MTSAPEIDIKPEYCPEAVIEWYRLTGLEDRKESLSRRDLALKAKQHLVFLKWNFWYVNKKDRWELRYTSPINGKNYISLRKACESCIEDGGCSTIHSSTTLQLQSATISSNDFGEIDQSTFNENSEAFSLISLQKCNVTTISEDGGYSTVQVPPTTTSSCPLHLNEGLKDFGEIVQSTSKDDFEAFNSVSLQKYNATTISEDEGCSIVHASTTVQPLSTQVNLKKRPRDFGETDQSTFNEKCNVTTIPASEITNSLRSYKRQKRQKVSNTRIMDTNLDGCDQNGEVLNSKVFEKREEALKVITREGCTFISWMVKNRVLVPGTNVFCRGWNNIVKIGRIVFDGIICDCCRDNFNIIEFESHAGCIRNSPSTSIMLEDGRSLLECQIEALN
ncbi:unnamed protein product [Lathyrus sativus]|nr:unnamed protein product [Lathyrus sativus]